MTTTFTSNQIERFKREATAMKKATGLTHAEALDNIANREKFANWSLLMKAAHVDALSQQNPVPQKSSLTYEKLLSVCQRYIEENDSTYTLCRNGSLWIDRRAVLNGNVTINSLHALGPRGDSRTRQYASDIGALPLTDFDGLADTFVLDTDEDEDGNPIEPGSGQLLYTANVGRRKLLECIQHGLEGDFDALMARIDEIQALA